MAYAGEKLRTTAVTNPVIASLQLRTGSPFASLNTEIFEARARRCWPQSCGWSVRSRVAGTPADSRMHRQPGLAMMHSESLGMIRFTLLSLLSVTFSIAAAQSPPCLADAFLDVSNAPGPGPGFPQARVEANCDGDDLVVRSNAIPHYEFVQITPNPLKEQDQEFRIPAKPMLARQPTPIPLLGTIGIAVNGIAIFGPNEGPVPEEEQFGDPIFNAIMDTCMGHTAMEYHYHALVQKCLSEGVREGEASPILGFGLDGFPIRGPWGCADKECSEVIRYRSSWEKVRDPHQDSWDAYEYVEKDGAEYLDACNGHTGPEGDYHYHATETWPYILGCYAGTAVGPSNRGARPPAVSQTRPGARGQPQGARERAAPPGPARRGPRAGPGRVTAEQVAAVAEELGKDEATVAKALRVEPGTIKPSNMAASARTLGVEQARLMEALGRQLRPRRPRQNQAPPGEPECFFRCGQSDEDAVGCTLTPDHKVLCFRPCDDNKCG